MPSANWKVNHDGSLGLPAKQCVPSGILIKTSAFRQMKKDEILEILRSIQDLRLDSDGDLEVKFKESDPVWKDGWEANSGYIDGSFTHQLLLLIEDSLAGKLPEQK